MKLYFIISNYQDNNYKISDFYNNDNTPKVFENKSLELQISAYDFQTEIAMPSLRLPDSTFINTYTHVAILDANGNYDKVYKITSYNYLNKNQIKLSFEDDPFIANYQILKTTDIQVLRTNDFSKFIGIHDIQPIPAKRTTSIVRANERTRTGKWAMFMFQEDATDVEFTFKKLNGAQYERIPTLAEIITKYPEVFTEYPETIPYFQKIVWLGTPTTILLNGYQCVFTSQGGVGKLVWTLIDQSAFGLENTFKLKVDPSVLNTTKVNVADINMKIYILPLSTNIQSAPNYKPMVSFYHYETNNATAKLLDIKIVDDRFFDLTTSYVNDGVNSKVHTNLPNGWINDGYPTSVDYALYGLSMLKTTIDVSRSFTNTFNNFPPFKNHNLIVYGQKYKINPLYFSNLKIELGMSSGTINYIIYFENKENIIVSGSFTHSTRYAVDRLNEFYQMNPTYKDQYALGMIQQSLGVVKNIGGSANEGVGILNFAEGFKDISFGLLNESLSREAKELQPDVVYGDNSDLALILNHLFAIYYVEETFTLGNNEMLYEYSLNGFPTNVKTNINALSYVNDTYMGNHKTFKGRCFTTIKNNYITNAINKKLLQGVILIE